jgi:hypothetical protein
MSKDRIKTNESPVILIDSCDGDLIIRGWADSALEVKGNYQIEESAKGYRLVGQGGLRLNVPADASLMVERVGGDAIIRHLTGSCAIQYIQGDASLAQSGNVELGIVHGDLVGRRLTGPVATTEVNGDVSLRGAAGGIFTAVHGDLSARYVDGNMTIDAIHGDANLRVVTGDLTISQGFRDVNLMNVSGLVNVSGVTGDIRLRGGLNGGDHSLTARGDIVVYWPPAQPLNFNATGSQIVNRLFLEDTTDEKGSLSGRIGKGECNLNVAANGRVILRPARATEVTGENWGPYGSDMEFDVDIEMAGITARVEAEVNNHLARVSRDIESRFGPDFGQRIAEKIARKAERAADHARRRADARGRGPWSEFTAPAASAAKPASTAEQLRILKMVESGKITPEEGSMLLEALES